ncbi:Anaphase-promoting complex subunit 1 [Geodia barretti]|uniref:Anaphase-promoting complex subunit 1 n=1 Tax=Geodia barretti TaxID=519541 RepID=A0AA35TNZ4_GEOBA|nr:Anaphase-promoting complex subunit 1 [Geodia barretti]
MPKLKTHMEEPFGSLMSEKLASPTIDMPMESPDAHVLQTCWVWFRLESSHQSVARERCLCRREKEFLTISTDSGAVHYVALPFVVEKMAPLSEGLLLERSTREETGSGLPTMFSLLSSTGDLSPIVTRQSFTHATSATTCSYVTDPHLHIVDSCPQDRDLVLLYHTSSQTHSIWRVRPTSAEDIPAHVANTPHPGRRSMNSSTAVTPRSTSAPSQYDLHPTTPSHRTDTPVQMILTGNKKLMRGLNKATPHMFSGGGGGGGRGGNRLGSGRSPFAPRLPTPLNLGNQKRSKSVSPMHQAGRLSPFSQTVHSNSWTTFFSEESAVALEPLLPQICIHKLAECVERIQGHALDFFTCGCLFPTGVTYYYFTTSIAELWVLSAECAEARTPALKLPASHAVPITDLNVVLVLSPRGELSVYSGVLKVCELGLEWLFANGDTDSGKVDLDQIEGERKLVSIRGGEGAQFSVQLSSGLVLTGGLPPIYPHTLVELSLRATTEVIPKDTAHLMLADYYSNCIQLSPSPFSIHHFLHWLLSLLQLPSLPPLEASQPFLLSQRNLTVLRLFEVKNECMPIPQPMPLPSSKRCLVQYARSVFKVLHLVYEELKVYSECKDSLPLLARFLHHVATCLGFPSYCDLYPADHPSLMPSSLGHTSEGGDEEEKMECEGEEEEGEGREDTHPPNLMSHLHIMLTMGAAGHVPFPLLSDVCKRTAQLVQLYALYSGGAGSIFSISSLFTSCSALAVSALTEWQQLLEKTSSPHQRVVLWIVAQGLTREDLASLPVGVALPLWDSIFHCRENPPPSDDLRLYELIGREDILKTLRTAAGDTTPLTIEAMEKDDGMKVDDEIIKLTFSKDLRVNEVKRLLNSSQPVKISLEQKPEVSDHEFIEQQELTLLTVCQRTMALPVGRGMFTLAVSKPLPTSPLSIPGVELTGRAPPKNSTVSLEHIEKPPNMVLWPQFHNGVAAGLRLSPNAMLDSTWILSNRPSPPLSTPASEDGSGPAHSRCSPQHAGLLLALGLSGHLSSLMDFELFDYLQDKHELTTVAVLLGITASRVGSMQRSIASILSIFLPPLLPFGSADMEISQTIQTAALTAMGLLYLGSGNRHLSEVMLREIAHVPGPELEFADDRESYSLSAGIALGMTTLGRGGDLPGMGDLRLVERLAVLILGGPKSQMLTGAAPNCPSHLILEPEVVNTHVTSPAATVALGLMYLKTNDSSVASRLDAPSTLYELDHIRPDFFILRMASRGLIMWSDVQPTQEWIDNHIPEIVQRHAFQSSDRMEGQSDPNIDYQTLSQAMVCISAGCCLAIGLRYAGTLDKQAHSVLSLAVM